MINPNEDWRSIEEIKTLFPGVDLDEFAKIVPLEISEDGKFVRVCPDLRQKAEEADKQEVEESQRTGKPVQYVDFVTGEETFSINHKSGVVKYHSNKRKKPKGFGK